MLRYKSSKYINETGDMDMRKFKIDDYEVIEDLGNQENPVFKALRHGEEWKDLIGDNFVYALVDRIADLEDEVKTLKEGNR